MIENINTLSIKTGKMIVIEGLDGSGKSTQWEMLKKNERLSQLTGRKSEKENEKGNIKFITFPDYDSESGGIIKRYLSGEFSIKHPLGENDISKLETSAYSATSFYAVDRYISYKTLWGQHYENGGNIISARYTSSNAIYQMAKLPRPKWEEYMNWLYDYEHNKLSIPKPNKVIFLDIPIEVSQKLIKRRNGDNAKADIHENNIDYLERCRQAALYIAERDKWVTINCIDENTGEIKSQNVISDEIIKVINEVL